MPQRKWETIISPKPQRNAPAGVRRIHVHGGYLYQVESDTDVEAGQITWIEWHAPVFVPFHGDGE
jgi:hypothetical protein